MTEDQKGAIAMQAAGMMLGHLQVQTHFDVLNAERPNHSKGCYKFLMAYNPLDWFRPSVAGEPAEIRKQFVAGLVV